MAAKKLTYDEALKKLESTVFELENGNPTLDKTIELYRDGMEYAALCKKYLDEAKQKIEIIANDGTAKPQGE